MVQLDDETLTIKQRIAQGRFFLIVAKKRTFYLSSFKLIARFDNSSQRALFRGCIENKEKGKIKLVRRSSLVVRSMEIPSGKYVILPFLSIFFLFLFLPFLCPLRKVSRRKKARGTRGGESLQEIEGGKGRDQRDSFQLKLMEEWWFVYRNEFDVMELYKWRSYRYEWDVRGHLRLKSHRYIYRGGGN